jgi:hypothetical protein
MSKVMCDGIVIKGIVIISKVDLAPETLPEQIHEAQVL